MNSLINPRDDSTYTPSAIATYYISIQMISIRLNMIFFLPSISRSTFFPFIFHSLRTKICKLCEKKSGRKRKEKKEVGGGTLCHICRHRRCCFVCSTWNYLGTDLCIGAGTSTCARTPKYQNHSSIELISFLYYYFSLLLLLPSV